jgi:hypothetical protein
VQRIGDRLLAEFETDPEVEQELREFLEQSVWIGRMGET